MSAFMTDPQLLASLEGQQYLVLRPTGAVAEFYDAAQSRLTTQLPKSISHPNTGHVTLRGFHEPTRVNELKAAISAWADQQPPIQLGVEAVDGFPPPFQIILARLHRSASLVGAYGSLTAALESTDFQRIGELPLDQWVFHMSLAYCGTLSEAEWRAVYKKSAHDVVPRPSEILTTAEFVWYQGGVEHAETIGFDRHAA